MSNGSTSLLTFPRWAGGSMGSRTIRYMYLTDGGSFRLSEGPQPGTGVPLYLGADLLSNTSIRTENHPRYHAKFARKGLATKIHFSSAFRFQGLKVPSANNGLWFYSVQGLFRVAFEMYSQQEQLAVLENFQDIWKAQIDTHPLEMTYSLCVRADVTTSGPGTEPQGELGPVGGCDAGSASGGQAGVVPSTLRQKLHSLDCKLSSEMFTEQQLETVALFLNHADCCVQGTLEEEDLTATVLALLQAKEWGSVYSTGLFDRVARWLGQHFHSANAGISQKVERFKRQHIERIGELPPAQELASELFPEAMQTLLLHWMGLSKDSTLEERCREYPILLLILEFVNHNLITGVAHVLYSSLICK